MQFLENSTQYFGSTSLKYTMGNTTIKKKAWGKPRTGSTTTKERLSDDRGRCMWWAGSDAERTNTKHPVDRRGVVIRGKYQLLSWWQQPELSATEKKKIHVGGKHRCSSNCPVARQRLSRLPVPTTTSSTGHVIRTAETRRRPESKSATLGKHVGGRKRREAGGGRRTSELADNANLTPTARSPGQARPQASGCRRIIPVVGRCMNTRCGSPHSMHRKISQASVPICNSKIMLSTWKRSAHALRCWPWARLLVRHVGRWQAKSAHFSG